MSEGIEGAVLDQPTETPEIESSGSTSSGEYSGGTQEGTQRTEDAYSSKSAREASQALKAIRDSNPEFAKHARIFKDAFAANYALRQIDPKGVDGVREKYAMLDSVVHGELKGVDAIGALQDELRGVQEIDERLFAGDASALKDMGEEFVRDALPKLAPQILDMVRDSNPEAYASAVLPHFVQALASSDLVRNHNNIVDVLSEKPPAWLPADKLQEWTKDRDSRLASLVSANSTWLNAQAAKAGDPAKPGGTKPGTQGAKPEANTELENLRKEQQETHWKTNIIPSLDKHAEKKFDEAFRPYAKRLNLDKTTAGALRTEFAARVARQSMKPGADGEPNPYAQQIQRYRNMNKPDATTVLNFAKVEFNKHADTIMKALVNERYKSFLNGRPQNTTRSAQNGGVKTGPVAPGVQIVTVKPANIDFKKTPLEWLHQKKYRTTDGKVVQVRQ